MIDTKLTRLLASEVMGWEIRVGDRNIIARKEGLFAPGEVVVTT